MASVGIDPVSGAAIETDQDDYVPGQLVHVTGHGWGVAETVHLFMTEDPDTHGDVTQDVQADSSGAFSIPFYDVQDHDLGVTFTLTATGLTSGDSAVAIFTDGTISLASIATRDASTCTTAQSTVASGSPICAFASFNIGGTGATKAQFRWKSPAGSIVQISQRTPDFPNGSAGSQTYSVTYAPVGAGTWTVLFCESGNTDPAPGGVAGCQSGTQRASQTFTVTAKANATIVVTGYSGTYNGAAHGATGTATGINGENLSALLHLGLSFSEVPGGTAHWTFDGNDSYNAASGDVAIAISQAPVTATAGNGSGTYNGSPQAPSPCGITGPYTGNLGCSNNPASVGPTVGTFVISPLVSGSGLSNFAITPVTGSYTISQAHVTATAGSGSGTYNGSAQAPSPCAVTGAYTGDLGCSNSPGLAGPNAGTTTITPGVTGTGLSNFDISLVNGSYTIDRAPVTATAGGGSGTYNGNLQSPAACVVSGLYTGDLTCGNNPIAVGPAAGTTSISPNVSGTGLTNFAITAVAGSYTIDKAPVKATAGGGSATYNGLTHAPSACGVTGSYTGNLYCTNSPSTVGPDAGTSAINPAVSGEDLGNFDITAVAGSFEIQKAPVTATAGSGSSTYDGNPHAPAACAVTGNYIGSLSCANDPASVGPHVGTFSINPMVNGPGQDNFEITVAGGSYEISKAPVTAKAGSGSGTYNGGTQSPSACAVTGTYTGDLSCANSPAAVGPNVGTTPIGAVVSGTGLSNFDITSVGGSYTINQAPVIATAGSGSSTYDGDAHAAAACVVAPAVPGGYTGDLSCANNPASVGPNAGTFDLSAVVTGTGLDNFAIGTVNGLYTIDKAPTSTTVNCPAGPYTYSGAAQTPCTAGATGAGGLSQAVDVSYADNINAGTATASASFAGDGNHLGSNGSATFTIDKASSTTTVTCPAGPYTYNGSAQTPCSASVSGAGGLSQTLSVSYISNTDAGSATASASFAGDDNHYGSNGSASFTIDKAGSSTAVTCPTNETYTGSALTPCSASAMGAGGLNQPLTVGYANNVNAGTATASASFDGDGNHFGSNGSATFTIDKAPSTTTVTCQAGPFTYNGSAQTPCSASVSGAGSLSQSLATSYLNNTNAGTATASASFAGDGNHLGSNGSATFTIDKAPVTATAGSGSTTYDRGMHAPSACALAGGYTGSLSCSNSPASVGPNAGTSTISPVVSGPGQTNFILTLVSGSYTIARKAAAVTPDPKSKFFGDPDPALTGTLSGFVPEDNVTASYSRVPGEMVGSYTISATLAPAGMLGNYDVTYKTAALTIMAWTLSGFYQPVDMPNPSIVWNTVKNGSTVPLKFEVFVGGGERTDVGAVKSFGSYTVACNTTSPTDDVEFTTTGGTVLRYDATAGQFIQNWQTPKLVGQCFKVIMTTQDGSSLVAYFKLK